MGGCKGNGVFLVRCGCQLLRTMKQTVPVLILVKKRIDHIMRLDPEIDTLILGCTHYPILMPKILKHVPRGVRIVPQGEYVAESLQDYFRRHPDMDARCTKNATVKYYTTENPEKFKETARIFLHEQVNVEQCRLGISLNGQ